MQAIRIIVTFILTFSSSVLRGQTGPESIQKMEAAGDTSGARTALTRAVEADPNSIPILTQYAEFLERYGDPGAREAYGKLLGLVRNSGDRQRAGVIARRLAVLDLLADDRSALTRDLDAYRGATGKELTLNKTAAAASAPWPT